MYAKLANAYYWPNLYTDTKNYVKSCHACQIAKKSKIRYGKITPHFEKDNRLCGESVWRKEIGIEIVGLDIAK